MLTGGAEKERKRRPAASPDLFHVSKHIHSSSNIRCGVVSSAVWRAYIYIYIYIYLVHYMAKTVMTFLSPPISYKKHYVTQLIIAMVNP